MIKRISFVLSVIGLASLLTLVSNHMPTTTTILPRNPLIPQLWAQSSGVGLGYTQTVNKICGSGDTYAVAQGDQGSLLWTADSNPCVVTLPQAGASSTFMANWKTCFKNAGSNVETAVPTTSTMDGQANPVPLFVGIGGGGCVISDGTNYESDNKSAPILLYRGYSNTTGTQCLSADGGSYNPPNSSGSATCTKASSLTAFPLFTFTIPANFFSTNHQITIIENFIGQASGSAPTMNFALQAGASGSLQTVWTGTATAIGGARAAAPNTIVWTCSGTAALGSSAAIECIPSTSQNGAWNGTAVFISSQYQNTTGIPTNGALQFQTQIIFGTSVATNWMMARSITVIGTAY
jgi:hypothetical protein